MLRAALETKIVAIWWRCDDLGTVCGFNTNLLGNFVGVGIYCFRAIRERNRITGCDNHRSRFDADVNKVASGN